MLKLQMENDRIMGSLTKSKSVFIMQKENVV